MKAYDFKVLLEPDEEAGGYVVSWPATNPSPTCPEPCSRAWQLPMSPQILRDADLTMREFTDLLKA